MRLPLFQSIDYNKCHRQTKLIAAIFSIILLSTVESVCGTSVGGMKNNELHVFDLSTQRRTHASLPRFSKKEKGKGSHSYYANHGYYEQEWKWERKSEKKYKDNKKDKKEGKKDKKEKYYLEQPIPTRTPTINPASFPSPVPSLFPTLRKNDSSGDGSGDGSGSEDTSPSSGISEDCPPARPPTVIPPSPNMTGKEALETNPQTNKKNAKHVGVELFAIDYTLFQTDRAPIKIDFLELQKVSETYFKDHMVNAYKVSTQVNLIDFTTSFVTAHFTPGEPVHIQFNSTASFDESSINIPTSETLFTVLEESIENPKSYTDKLKSELNKINPFSSTTSVVFTDPKTTPATRTASTRAKNMFGIAGAGVVMALAFAMFTGVNRQRNIDETDDIECNTSFSKKISCETTVAGDTFVIENNDSTYDGCISIFSSDDLVANKQSLANSSIESFDQDDLQISSGIRAPHRKPRTVAEIESLFLREGEDT